MTHPTTHTPDELDDLIIQEKLQVALELQHDAWAESAADGIEPEIIADAAMITAIRETVRAWARIRRKLWWNRSGAAFWPANFPRNAPFNRMIGG
jgi:hypothetical protein